MKVSVITPAFNEGKYLGEMIESILRQSHSDWELLLVDDGSSDDTPDIISHFATLDPRIKAISLGSKLGKVSAFNLAYSHSSGDLICHVGGDDIATVESLGKRVGALSPRKDLPAVAFSKIEMFKDGDATRTLVNPRGARGNRSGPGITLTRPLADMLFPIPSHLVSEDIWLGLGAEAAAVFVEEITEPLVLYRMNPGNSNPRSKPFAEMSKSINCRMAAIDALLQQSRFDLGSRSSERLSSLRRIEEERFRGNLKGVLTAPGVPLIDRIATASMTKPALWSMRQKAYLPLSGWR